MSILEMIILAIGLAMDATAVSICKGLTVKKAHFKQALILGLYFGIFQAGMPLIGYLLGSTFEGFISNMDHWIAFGLLLFIGGKMIYDGIKNEEEEENNSFAFKVLVILAIATSIDALAVGITFAFLKVNIWLAITFIGIITMTFSMIGFKIGNIFGSKYKRFATLFGGIVLVLIGTKILFGHLGIIAF